MNGKLINTMDSNRPLIVKQMHSFKEFLGLNKARIYNLQHRKKPAELVRKDLISAMKMADHENLNREHYLRILDPWREEWEKGVQVPVNADALPQPTIKLIGDSADVVPSTSNSNSPIKPKTGHVSKELPKEPQFKLPTNLIKYEENGETSSSRYELDLHDICWLETVNASDLSIQLSDNLLEDVVNELEQQCARNIKEQHMGIEYDDHIVCDVCQFPDAEDDNEMVFCESCNICVHQACYGILEIPAGDWFCNICRDLGSKKNTVCVLCPNVGGALKPTTSSKWCHVSCAYWIPEVKFLNLSALEPIDIKSIPSWRWNTVCSLCNVKKGTPIICDSKNCRTSYHVTCAFKQKLKMKIVLKDDSSDVMLKSYCQKHSQEQPNLSNDSSTKELDYISRIVNDSESVPKSINPQYEFWKYVDVSKVYQEISKKYLYENDSSQLVIVRDCEVSLKSLQQIIDLVHNYWKLKRISNYGNSLIKLTFAQKFEEEMQFQQIKMREFRFHLERLRTLSYMLGRREKIKAKWIAAQKEIFVDACKMFAGVDLSSQTDGQPESEQHESSSLQPHLTNDALFQQILQHNNIYQREQSVDSQSNEQPTIELNKSITSSIGAESSLGPDEVARTRENTPSVCSSRDGFSFRNRIKHSGRKPTNMTEHILKKLKQLSSDGVSKTPKQYLNPYARVYRSSSSKRKPNENEEAEELRDDASQSSGRSSSAGQCFTEPSSVTNINPTSSTSNSKKNHESSRTANASSVKRKLDMSLAEESDVNSGPYLATLNDHLTKKVAQLKTTYRRKSRNMVMDAQATNDAKRAYNFRKATSIGSSEEVELLSINRSHQKENGHCVNQSIAPVEFFESFKSPERGHRINRRELNGLLLPSTEKPPMEENEDRQPEYSTDVYDYADESPSLPKYERKSLRSTSNSENRNLSLASLNAKKKRHRFQPFSDIHGSNRRRINSN